MVVNPGPETGPRRAGLAAAYTIDDCLVYHERGGVVDTWHVGVASLYVVAATRFELGARAPAGLLARSAMWRKAVLSGVITGWVKLGQFFGGRQFDAPGPSWRSRNGGRPLMRSRSASRHPPAQTDGAHWGSFRPSRQNAAGSSSTERVTARRNPSSRPARLPAH